MNSLAGNRYCRFTWAVCLAQTAFFFVGSIATAEEISKPSAAPSADKNSASPQETVFQPGVRIDWERSIILLEGEVVLRRGPLEFLACFTGKEHESIIRLKAQAIHVYLALGLVGLTANTNLQPESLCDIDIRYSREGKLLEIDAHDWLIDRQFGQVPPPRAWRFIGSQSLGNGGIVAESSGAGVAVVSMPDALIEPTRAMSSSDAKLWCRANTARIPARGEPATLIIKPARPGRLEPRLDASGLLWIGKTLITTDTLIDLLRQQNCLTGHQPVTIHTDPLTLQSDLQRLRQRLSAVPGIVAVRFEVGSSTPVEDTSESAR
jgi:hypothetical protein